MAIKQYMRNDNANDQRRVVYSVLTCSHVQKVLAAGTVDFDVPVAHEMLVPAQRQVPLFARLELDQRLAVTPPLPAQAQGDAASD